MQRIACTALLCVACNQVEGTAPDRAEPPPPPEDDLLAPEQPSRVRRLSHEQWRLSVGELLAVSQDQALASLLDDTVQSFPKDSRTAGYIFDAPGESLAVDALLWNFYSRGAQALAEAVTSQEEYLQNIWPPNLPLEAEAIAGFIEDFGEKVHRRPLSAEELSTYENLYAAIATGATSEESFINGVKGLIAAFLQSPYFVYRLELEPTEIENFAIVDDTTHSSQQIVRFPVGGYERASRLSFFFWNRGPDEELLRAAREGDLNERSGVLAQAERLAQDERTLASWDEFFAGIFDEERWLTIAPSAEILSEIPEQLVGTAISESRAFLREEIFLREGGVKELFTSTRSWVDPTLAAIYGVEYPDVEDGPLYREVELPAEQRSGILTQLGFLASHATSRYPDPIHRGVYVAKRLACLTIAAPPDDIPPIPPAGERTNRERIAAHTESGTCANCHQYLINPFGFAFENYDAVGAYRDEDNDQPVDASVVIALDREEHAIDGAIELSQLFSTSPQVHECIAQHLISFAEGRTLARTPPPFVAELGNLSLQGASFQDLMIQLAASEAFLYRQEVVEKESPAEPLNDEQLDDEQEEESP